MKDAYLSVRDNEMPVEWCRYCAHEVDQRDVVAIQKDESGDVSAMGIEIADHVFPIFKNMAQYDLSNVEFSYWSEVNGHRSWVRVKHREGDSYYLTTEQDDSDVNNLLELPEKKF